jgi:hypothetical protein
MSNIYGLNKSLNKFSLSLKKILFQSIKVTMDFSSFSITCERKIKKKLKISLFFIINQIETQ